MSEPNITTDPAWDEWFDAQYELTERIDKAIAGLAVGKDDAFKLAVWAAVVEHAAESMRMYIPMSTR
jgi:hypothetical protein